MEPTIFPITQDNIHQAVRDWVSNRTHAESLYGHIEDWDVSRVRSMNGLFDALDGFPGFAHFNEDISRWNTRNVKDMQLMFRYATKFDKDISGWKTAKVIRMDAMFHGATSFNQNISSWNTTSVRHMQEMFREAWSFNYDLSEWDVDNVFDLSYMFHGARSFDQEICWRTRTEQNDADVLNMFCGSQGDFEHKCLKKDEADQIVAESRQDCATPAATVQTATPTMSPTQGCDEGNLVCLNGGQCLLLLIGWRCVCPEDYAGEFCEKSLN